MPKEIKLLLDKRGLMEIFLTRPPYQRNDYLGWIERAKRKEIKEKRTKQMFAELEMGDVYMKMTWSNPNNR